MIRQAVAAATLILVAWGCGDSSPQSSKSKYLSTDSSYGEALDVDTRVSINGKRRDTLPTTTTDSAVTYHNPKTGTTSKYALEVDRDEDGTLQRINFPSSGWIEVNGDTVDNHDGTETFTDHRGYQYTVEKPTSAKNADANDNGAVNASKLEEGNGED